MKKLIIALFFTVFACKKQEDLKQLNFYGEAISVPSYLITDKVKVDANSCKSNHYLKNEEGTVFISIELCEYSFKKRPNFTVLKKYFEEGEALLKAELSNLTWVNKKSLNKEGIYEFTYEFKTNSKFYQNTRYAHKNFYIGVKIEGNDKNKIKDLVESIDKIKNLNFSNDIRDHEKENNCFSCRFPSSW